MDETQVAQTPKRKKPLPKKRKQNTALTRVAGLLILFLAFYAVLSLFVGAMILYSFNDTAKNTEIYSMNVVFDKSTLHKMSAEDANNEYGLYIPFSYLSEIGSFGIAGDGDDITLFIIGTDNRIECKKNSSLIVINGNAVRITAPILMEEDELLVPIVLIEKYINGIEISYNDDKMVCTVSSDVGKSDIALSMLLPEGMKNADFPDSYKYYGNVPSEEPGL